MAATIKDVAKKANVSISTVSRVLSNQMHVSSSTYKRIQDAVAELNYIPNSSAVSLVKKSSTTVLYADSFYKGRPYENPHMFDIISGSSHELRKKGYFLGLLDLDCSKEKAEEQIINAIQSKKADGILINGYYVTPAIEKILLATDFPHICIGKPSFDSMLSWIDTNHSLSSNLAITHLVSLGHKKIGYIGETKNEIRYIAYRNTLKDHRIAFDKNLIANVPVSSEGGYQGAQRILKRASDITAFFCMNDITAIGAIRAIKESGHRIPSDIAVISMDDIDIAQYVSPMLTTMHIPIEEMGKMTAKTLIDRINNGHTLPLKVSLPYYMAKRESCL